MPLFFDIGQGAGLAGATGVRPFLPPLLAGGLAVGDLGIDFDGTDYAFLESPWFFALLLALALASLALERRRGGQPERGRVETGLGVIALALGALLFAGALADGGYPGWPGLVAGAGCAGVGFAAGQGLFGAARRRLEAGPAMLLTLYADAVAVALAALAIFVPPASFLALAALAALLVRARRARGRKFEGLRILR